MSLLAAEAYLAAARRAAEPATICGDIRTPGLSPGTGTGRLTRREREVAG